MKKARILSSESDASIKIKQQQDTNIDLSIAPPSQSVNFQPSPMAELATMEPPSTPKPSTFKPLATEDLLIGRPKGSNILLMPQGPVQPRRYASARMDGLFAPASEQVTVKASQSLEERVRSRDIEEPMNIPMNEPKKRDDKPQKMSATTKTDAKPNDKAEHQKEPTKVIAQPERSVDELPLFERRSIAMNFALPTLKRGLSMTAPIGLSVQQKEIDAEAVINGPFIDSAPMIIEERGEPIPATDISIIDELKRPMEVLTNAPANEQQEQLRLREVLNEKTKRAHILEAMLEIYENKHQIINNQLTCKRKQLEELVKAYTGASGVELMIENEGGCGCTASAPKVIDIESIIVTVGGKSFDFRFGFNDAYADMVRHGINLKQCIA